MPCVSALRQSELPPVDEDQVEVGQAPLLGYLVWSASMLDRISHDVSVHRVRSRGKNYYAQLAQY